MKIKACEIDSSTSQSRTAPKGDPMTHVKIQEHVSLQRDPPFRPSEIRPFSEP